MARKTTAYQNRLADIKRLENEVFKLKTQNDTVAYDNREMQAEYNRMEQLVESWKKRFQKQEKAVNDAFAKGLISGLFSAAAILFLVSLMPR